MLSHRRHGTDTYPTLFRNPKNTKKTCEMNKNSLARALTPDFAVHFELAFK